MKNTRVRMIERSVTSVHAPEVIHQDHQHFILNSAAFYNGTVHRRCAAFWVPTTTPRQWERAILRGLESWGKAIAKQSQKKQATARKAAAAAATAVQAAEHAAAQAEEAADAVATYGAEGSEVNSESDSEGGGMILDKFPDSESDREGGGMFLDEV